MSLFTGWQYIMIIIILMWVWSEWFYKKMSKLIDEKFAVEKDSVYTEGDKK